MLKKFTALFAAAVLVMSGCSAVSDGDTGSVCDTGAVRKHDAAYETASPYIRGTRFSLNIGTPEPTAEPAEAAPVYEALDMEALKASVESEISSADGVWSVYIKDLNAGNEILINDAPMKAASVMKLFVMGAAFDNIKTGLFEYEDLQEDMYYMITESSNESANAILYALGSGSYAAGIDKVNAFTDKYGYNEKTVEYNGFDNPDTIVGGSFNVTSAHDCGMMLDAIYNGRCVSFDMSGKMLELLKDQQTDYKLAYTLPDYAVVANKSGEMDKVENDVGIVYSPGRDYIICVLSNDWSDNADAIETIQDISRETYDFFNPDDPQYVLVKTSEENGIVEVSETPYAAPSVEIGDVQTGETEIFEVIEKEE